MSRVPPRLPYPSSSSSSSRSSRPIASGSRSSASVDMTREDMQPQPESGAGVGGESTIPRQPPGRPTEQVAGGHEVSRILSPYELQPLPSSMFYNKEFTTNPFAYATTQQSHPAPPNAPSPHQYGYHPYRVPHSSSPPSLFASHNMVAMPSFVTSMQESYGGLTHTAPPSAGSGSSSMGGSVVAGSITSGMGSPLSSFGSAVSDMSSMGYSPPMQAPSQLRGMAYANPRELTARRTRSSHRRMHSRSVKSEDDCDDDDGDDDMQSDEDRVAYGMSGSQKGGAYSGLSREAKAEAGRLSRIQSEQRLMWQKRRNVLKDGFERLRVILPSTSQKGSKQVILDRAVQHIDTLKSSYNLLMEERNRLVEENRRLTDEILELRRANNLLVSQHIPSPNERGPSAHSTASNISRGSAHYSTRQ